MNVLVIDVGTSSMRGILFQQEGKITEQYQVKYSPEYKGNGRVEQDAEIFRKAMTKIVKKITDCTEYGIDAVSITSQRSSIVPADNHMRPLSPFIMWQDTRNHELCAKLESRNEVIRCRSGAKVNTVFSGAKMSWIRKELPELYKQTYKFITIPEYLIYTMTGDMYLDYTYASRSNLMDLKEKKWDLELLDIFRVEKDKLNPLVPAGCIVGYITGEYARNTGLKAGIPVISAGGDQQCATLGLGIYQGGDLSIITGSGAFLAGLTNKIPKNMDENLICNCSLVGDRYIVEASVLNCCTAFDWFCRNIYNTQDYNQINRILEEAYERDTDCINLPFYQGRTTPIWNSAARGTFGNLDLSMDRDDLMKATVEGIFLEIKNNIQLLKRYLKIERIYVGGGLTNSKVMNQMQADIYGETIHVSSQTEATAAGALCMAWKSLGYVSTLEAGIRKIQKKQTEMTYTPNLDKQKIYQKKLNEMNQLYLRIYGGEKNE